MSGWSTFDGGGGTRGAWEIVRGHGNQPTTRTPRKQPTKGAVMADVWTHKELVPKIAAALTWAYDDAFLDEEVGVEGEGLPLLVQYDLDTNEPIARFEITGLAFTRIPLAGADPEP